MSASAWRTAASPSVSVKPSFRLYDHRRGVVGQRLAAGRIARRRQARGRRCCRARSAGGGRRAGTGGHDVFASAGGPRRHVHVLQGFGRLRILLRHTHHDVVLVQLIVDVRHLALAEGVVQRISDVARGDAHARSAFLVDRDIGFHAVFGLVGVDVD
jgi:hypothetical protein